ncbi:MAG TPA: DISARM system phospholipase D-like protein DrmC [Candidatus Xenobia bacterium]
MLDQLSYPTLESLADALAGGRVGAMYPEPDLRMHVPERHVAATAAWLRGAELSPKQAALVLRSVAAERRRNQEVADRVELVWSGLDPVNAETRDTAVVVQQLFQEARRSVLVASYALDPGSKARDMFQVLARRMDGEPSLEVRFFLNISPHDNYTDDDAVKVFSRHFRTEVWPGKRLPLVYYDPRALKTGATRSCLHAKCVVVDGQRALVTSANFTEAAHARNLEAGLLLSDTRIATALCTQFTALVEGRELKRLPGT